MSALRVLGLLFALYGRMSQRRIQALRDQSRLMLFVIGIFVVGYWIAAYVLFRSGFGYLVRVPGLGEVLMDRMLYLFFAFLLVMLFFSNVVIGYSTLFKSPETGWLLTLPIRYADVFRWKTVETVFLASWAFLFLAAPFVAAYGVVRDAAPVFYLKALLLFVPFIIIPGGLGLLVVLALTRFLHRQYFKWGLFTLGTALVIFAGWYLRPVDAAQLQQTELVQSLNQLLANSRIALQPLLPSYWMATGMIAWGEGWSGRGLFFFLLLLSNAMMVLLVCSVVSQRLFYESWSRNKSQGTMGAPGQVFHRNLLGDSNYTWLERLMSLWPCLHPATRALMIKDMRVFWRDTSQWSQVVIFFGLLGLYVINLRNVSYDWNNQHWAGFVAFLNLGASSMTLATLTTRFVYPQFSLEIRRLWIVGLVPYGLKRVVLEKFWLSSAWSVCITFSLTCLSSWMLQLPGWMTILFSATAVLVSLGLCGIAVGIGALFPDLGSGSTANRYDNPAKIVSGFGGTFCFVVSVVYIALVIAAEAVPIYFSWGGNLTVNMVVAWLFVSLLSLLMILVPMSLALHKVSALEV
ncbi:MAG: hypothetical protein N3A53_04040 [Verrucomicrobiae bacterium]|nr:hypothetical protein [Verrucomicrobiae bacterium]